MGTVAVRVTVDAELPPTDKGLLYPEPEFCIGDKVITAAGLVTVDPSNVTSGNTLLTNINLSPSSKSNSEEVKVAVIALAVALSWLS
tara:strand:- start:116 stop:376 length:261 start_codon:yes stop_codon:yes gene_type:complete